MAAHRNPENPESSRGITRRDVINTLKHASVISGLVAAGGFLIGGALELESNAYSDDFAVAEKLGAPVITQQELYEHAAAYDDGAGVFLLRGVFGCAALAVTLTSLAYLQRERGGGGVVPPGPSPEQAGV